jgi:hypothetical protein
LNKALDPTARAGWYQACGLSPSAVLAGQRRDYTSKSINFNVEINLLPLVKEL